MHYCTIGVTGLIGHASIAHRSLQVSSAHLMSGARTAARHQAPQSLCARVYSMQIGRACDDRTRPLQPDSPVGFLLLLIVDCDLDAIVGCPQHVDLCLSNAA